MDKITDRFFCKNAISLLVVLTLLFVFALGCSFDLGKKLNTSTETSASPAPIAKKDSEESAAKKPINQADASKKEVPSDDEAQEMAKTTLLEFNKGIQKEDFTDFYDTISRTWKKEITPQKFNEAFAEFIDKGVDLSDISAEEADFSPRPSVAKEQGYDMLTLAGEYDTSPSKTKFELKYIPQGKEWKLSRIRVILGP
jgi:hypothetical protein